MVNCTKSANAFRAVILLDCYLVPESTTVLASIWLEGMLLTPGWELMPQDCEVGKFENGFFLRRRTFVTASWHRVIGHTASMINRARLSPEPQKVGLFALRNALKIRAFEEGTACGRDQTGEKVV
jgi:hypothetical protein